MAFLDLVAAEVEEQVTRLQTHVGYNMGRQQRERGRARVVRASIGNPKLYGADYVKLYVDTIRAAVAAADPAVAFDGGEGRAFVDSSPSNGLSSGSDDLYVKRWNESGSIQYGDTHYYDYEADCEDVSTYPKSRFVSEHGFQSFPSFEAYRDVLDGDRGDFSRDSAAVAFRQRHENGDEELLAMVQRHFFVPPSHYPSNRCATDDDDDAARAAQERLFDAYCWLTQLQQARCYQTALTTWRRLKGDDTVRTMGVLYWQLNDLWQGPTWASLEYGGRWKAVQYAVRDAFAPFIVTAYLDDAAGLGERAQEFGDVAVVLTSAAVPRAVT